MYQPFPPPPAQAEWQDLVGIAKYLSDGPSGAGAVQSLCATIAAGIAATSALTSFRIGAFVWSVTALWPLHMGSLWTERALAARELLIVQLWICHRAVHERTRIAVRRYA